MNKLGNIITALFPETIARLVLLSSLKDKANKIRIKQNAMYLTLSDTQKYEVLSKYYNVTEEFHNNKYFWMKDLPIFH